MSNKGGDKKRKEAPAEAAAKKVSAPSKAAAPKKPQQGPIKKKLKVWNRKPISFISTKGEKKVDKIKVDKKVEYVKKNILKPTAVQKATKKGGKVLVVRPRIPRTFPAPVHHQRILKKRPTAKLRKSITPGTILILLAGRFKGRRVVFLKQLASGLLLITGPFKVNGVPLRRVDQRYVIATSTKVDISEVHVPVEIDDEYLAKTGTPSKRLRMLKHFYTKRQLTSLGRRTPKHILILKSGLVGFQKSVDSPIIKKIKTVPTLRKYLTTSFSLKKGQYPHELKF